MKIALVILHADPARGGAERYTVDLAAALAKRGHDVSLLASSFAAPIAGVTDVPIDASGLTRAGRYRSFLAALDDHLAKTSYDVVHAMLPVHRCDVYHPHAGIAAAAEQKWNIHLNPRRKRMAAVERALITGDCPPVTIALSEYVKRSIRGHYPLPDAKLATLFNAVDLDRFCPRPSEGHAVPRALIVAQDFERKGVGTLLAANEILNDSTLDPPVKIVVVGGTTDTDLWNTTARTYDGGDSVEFVGIHSDVRRFYADADFFVLPTKHDPCSLVVLEALAMGLPVISTVFNGATEIMTDGVHGYVLKDPTDVNALADAMRKMLDPERRKAMREACLALRPKLSYEHHLDQLLAIYERATTRR